MTSELLLDVPQIKNTKILRIIDSSYYNPDTKISCGQLLITPPGFSYPVGFVIDPYFSLVVNTATLGLSDTCYNCVLDDLPDGIYIIHYSINPNEDMFVEYNHMRVAAIEKLYAETLCGLYTREGSFRTDEFNKSLSKLKDIKRLIDASVIMVQEKHFNEKGLELYQKAWNELDKYKNKLTKCKNC